MIFVTGANGLIGSYICRDLLAQGYTVGALKRADSDLRLVQDIQDKIVWAEGDLLDMLALEKALQGAAWVIHAAAFISYDSRDEDTMYKINVEGTANVVNACLTTGVSHLLHVSSVAAIGKSKTSDLVDETSGEVQPETATRYARSKYLSEMEIWRGNTEGLQTVIVNPSLVLGPGDWEKSSTKIFKYIWDENRFYTGGVVNYVDVRDVSEVVVKLLKANISGERYIVSAGSTTYKTLFDRIAAAFGKKPPTIQVKGIWIRLAILVSGWKARLSGSKPLVSNELEQVSSNRHIFDSSKVQKALGFSFRKLEETVPWCCEQLLKNLPS